MKKFAASFVLSLAFVMTCQAAEKVFDPKRDPVADVQAAEKTAKAEGKYILLDIGGNWCSWCKILEKTIHATPSLAAALDASFVTVHVNWSPEQENTAFLGKYPNIPGFPHFIVLSADGKLLKSVGTEDFEADHKESHGYNIGKLIAFALSWSAKQSHS
jgi:thioredoxin-related protein